MVAEAKASHPWALQAQALQQEILLARRPVRFRL